MKSRKKLFYKKKGEGTFLAGGMTKIFGQIRAPDDRREEKRGHSR